MQKKMDQPADDRPDKQVSRYTPKVFALRTPEDDICEMVITTTGRHSHVYHLTYDQIRLLAMQAEKARLNWPRKPKLKE